MKKHITVALILISGAIAFYNFGVSKAQEQTKPCEGKVGDVKYSVLDNTKFKKLNGEEWVEMDGRTLEEKDYLANEEPLMKKLPDARGVFIRGMDLGREAKTGDGDVDGNRGIGLPQSDTFQGHWHTLMGWFNDTPPGGGTSAIVLSRKREVDWDKLILPNNQARSPRTDNENGTPRISKETRPRNIALYTYIKINKCQGEN